MAAIYFLYPEKLTMRAENSDVTIGHRVMD